MVPIGIRLYRDEDFSQVVEIAISTLGASRSEAEGYLCWASNERERHGTAQIFIAESDGKVVGFLILQWGGDDMEQYCRDRLDSCTSATSKEKPWQWSHKGNGAICKKERNKESVC